MERKKNWPRADKLLKERYPSLSGSQIDEVFARGLVAGAKGDRLDPRTTLDTARLDAHLASLRRRTRTVTVVADEGDFLVVDKPAGMPGHPLSLFDTDTLTHCFPELAETFPSPQPTLVPHRLDTGTSGLIIVAKTPAAFETWRERFKRKEVSKRYLAWCWGEGREGDFEINLSIAHAPGAGGKMTTPANGERYVEPVMEAQSLVRIVDRVPGRHGGVFLVEVTCHTGVTHQVRVHLAAKGYPLVGDELYDSKFATRPYRQTPHLLRASELTFGGQIWRADTEAFRRPPT